MLKFFIICLLAVSCRGAPLSEDQVDEAGENDVAVAYIRLNHFENEMLPPELCTFDSVKTNFKLYTRENPNGVVISPFDNQTLITSSFNVKQDTKVLIHEWLQNETHSYAKEYVAAFLRNKKEPVNIITVDYGTVSRCSFKAVRNLQPVIGAQLGALLKSLMQYGAVPSKFHLIGLGMGSHIAGIAARQIHPRKVGRLTALDPTFLGYINNKPQLNSNDSDYMDVIHTAQRKLDIVKHLGNARFFPNDGTRQPIATGKNPTDASVLSHIAAAFYYLQSIIDTSSMKAKACSNYLKYVTNQCPKPEIENNMGDEVNIKLRGNFYLGVPSALPPFTNREMVIVETNKDIHLKGKIVTPRRAVEIDMKVNLKVKTEYEKTIHEKTYNENDIKEIVNQLSQKSHQSA